MALAKQLRLARLLTFLQTIFCIRKKNTCATYLYIYFHEKVTSAASTKPLKLIYHVPTFEPLVTLWHVCMLRLGDAIVSLCTVKRWFKKRILILKMNHASVELPCWWDWSAEIRRWRSKCCIARTCITLQYLSNNHNSSIKSTSTTDGYHTI